MGNSVSRIIACIVFFSIVLNGSLFAGTAAAPFMKGVSSLGIFNFVLDTAAPITAVNELVKKIVLNEEINVPSKSTEKSNKKEEKSGSSPAINLFPSNNSEKTARYIKAPAGSENIYLTTLANKPAIEDIMPNAPPGNLVFQFTFIFLIIYLAILFRDSWAKILLSIKRNATVS